MNPRTLARMQQLIHQLGLQKLAQHYADDVIAAIQQADGYNRSLQALNIAMPISGTDFDLEKYQ